jgi:peroxiredoxin
VDPIIAIGEEAPLFQLSDLRGDVYSLAGMRGWIIVLNFWSAECVWCQRVDQELMGFLDSWKQQVKVLWIASNGNETLDLIERAANNRNLPTVLVDEHQQVANLYGAEMTPQFFVIDTKGKLAYQGSWDNVTFRQRVATQVYVPQVVRALMENLAPWISQTPPYGCVLVRFPASTGYPI